VGHAALLERSAAFFVSIEEASNLKSGFDFSGNVR